MMQNTEIPLPTHLPFELVALEKAVRYQQWIIETIQPYVGKRILELGAGIGNMSRWFKTAEHLVLTETDPELLQCLEARANKWFPNSSSVSVRPLDIAKETLHLFADDNIDTIVSFNVLEHIEDHHAVLQQCVNLLRQSSPGKKTIITFVPAHAFAYGVMDKTVGHFRRYNKKMFKELHQQIIPDAKLILQPFNFVGLLGWVMNGRVLQKNSAGSSVIGIFETLCPLIKFVDSIVIKKMKIPLGQSLLAIQEFTT